MPRSLRERYLSRPSLAGLKELEKKRPLKLQERDFDILKLLFDHRLMNLRQLEYLLEMTTEGKKQSLRRRMRQLYRYHLVDQPEDSLYLRLKYGDNTDYNTSMYGISDRGITLLVKERGLELKRSQRRRKNELAFLGLQHALYLSRFATVLKLALRKKPRYELNFWKQGYNVALRLQQPSPAEGYELDHTNLRPDSFFSLWDKSRDEDSFFFVEIDRSGEHRVRQMVDVYRRYWQLHKQGRHQTLGIEPNVGYQVLTFCLHPERVEKLLSIFQKYPPWNDIPEDHKPTMFLFTDNFGTYEAPELIFKKIWKSPKGERLSILD